MFDFELGKIEGLEELKKRYPVLSAQVTQARLTEANEFLAYKVRENTPEGAGVPTHLKDQILTKTVKYGEAVSTFTHCPYGLPVEEGSRPHWPPWGAGSSLYVWVERKLGITGKDTKSVAFLIARSISKKGTKGIHMFERAWQDNHAKILSILDRIPDEIIRKL